jgi:uncharacterized membrane protein
MNAALKKLTTVMGLAVLTLLIDIPWLYTNLGWSSDLIRGIQGSEISLRVWPALVVYVAIGYLISTATSVTGAMALGVATYAVYDFTNYATLAKYDPLFAVVDTLWGGVLFGLVFSAAKRIRAFGIPV